MLTLLDSSVWVHYFRPKTPRELRVQAAGLVDLPGSVTCEPVKFEVLRGTSGASQKKVIEAFENIFLLESPANLWEGATKLGVACSAKGLQVTAIDLLIAQIAMEHDAELVTYDADYLHVQRVAPLKLRFLKQL